METQTLPGHGATFHPETPVENLVPEGSREIKLEPETAVLCINRGDEVVKDTFDSRHYAIPKGYFTISYGAALHFKARAVVPGSRDPISGFQASFIAIIGVVAPSPDGFRVVRPVDHPDTWPAFDEEERAQYGMVLEGIDRSALPEGDRDVTIIGSKGGGNAANLPASRVKSSGANAGPGAGKRGRGPQMAARLAGGGEVPVKDVLANPDQDQTVSEETGKRPAPRRPNAAMRQIAADTVGAASEGKGSEPEDPGQ